MKRVELEKQAITKALHESPNISEAAKTLGASRRTLQARMRDYAIPRGQPGRPRQLLPKAAEHFNHARHHVRKFIDSDAFPVVVLAAGAAFVTYLYRRSLGNDSHLTLGSGGKTADLHGLDVICSRR